MLRPTKLSREDPKGGLAFAPTGRAVSAKRTGNAEFSELMPDHIFGNQHLVEDFPVVHQEGVADELGNNGRPSGPGFDGIPCVGIPLAQDLAQEFFVKKRSFF